MALQVPSGVVTQASGWTPAGRTAYLEPLPVAVFDGSGNLISNFGGAGGSTIAAFQSGTSIVLSGGTGSLSGLNVILSGGAGSPNISGGVTVSGSVQVSGTVTALMSGSVVAIASGFAALSGTQVIISGGAFSSNISGGITISGGVTVSGSVQVSGTVRALVSGDSTVATYSGGTPISFESAAQPNIKATLFVGGAQIGNGDTNSDAQAAGSVALGVLSKNFVFNGTSNDRERSVDAISGGTKSGIGILAAEILAFDYSGATHRQIGTSASGSNALAVVISGGGGQPNISGGVTVSGGLTVSGIVGISGGVAGLSGVILSVSGSVRAWLSDGGGNKIDGTGIPNADDVNYGGTIGLITASFSLLYDGDGATRYDRFRTIQAASGIAGTIGAGGIAAVGPMGLNPAGNFEPIKSTSGALNVITYYQYANATGAAITNVQSGASVLHTVNINTWVSGGQVQIRDSLSGNTGTAVATIDFTEVGALATNAFSPQTMTYDCYMKSGIVIVTSGAGMDVTITFKNPP